MTEPIAFSRRHVRHELVQRHLTVSVVRPVTSRIVRVTLTGDLAGFAAEGPTDHVKVFFPDPVTVRPGDRLDIAAGYDATRIFFNLLGTHQG